jgi:hypothetical protein
MSLNSREMAMRLVAAFDREHPEYSTRLNRDVLIGSLEQVYGEVLRGDHLAKTEEQLETKVAHPVSKSPNTRPW